MTTWFKTYFVRCALLLAGAVSGWGQFTSSIEGTVTDSSSAAIPGATITLLNTGTGIKITIQSNSAGYFLFPSLPAGVFNLSASGSGFKTSEISDLKLEAGGRRTVNMALEVGTQATVVTVKAEVAAVELSDVKVAGMIESKQLSELPVAGRNFMSLAALLPGVTGALAPTDIFAAQAGVNFNDRPNGERGREHRPHPGWARPTGDPRRSADRGHQPPRRVRGLVCRVAGGEDDPPASWQPAAGIGCQCDTDARVTHARHRHGYSPGAQRAGGYPVHHARRPT